MPITRLRTRQSITWRIPIDLLDRVEALADAMETNRTAVVVSALEAYLKRYLEDNAPRRAR